MFTRVCKADSIDEGGMRLVIVGTPLHPKESALAEYPEKIEQGIVYIDTAGISPLFAAP